MVGLGELIVLEGKSNMDIAEEERSLKGEVIGVGVKSNMGIAEEAWSLKGEGVLVAPDLRQSRRQTCCMGLHPGSGVHSGSPRPTCSRLGVASTRRSSARLHRP